VAEAREKMKLANAECHREGQEAVDGVQAGVYKVHTRIDGQEAELQLWIVPASGLPVRVTSVHAEGKMKSENRLA
jgi:hypothetical protein